MTNESMDHLANVGPSLAMKAYGRVDIPIALRSFLNSVLDAGDSVEDTFEKD
jgi:hypothetical protein